MADTIASLPNRNLREAFREPDIARRRMAIAVFFTEDPKMIASDLILDNSLAQGLWPLVGWQSLRVLTSENSCWDARQPQT
ncbi:MAG TPA: hypothetical protein VNR89_18780 [Roseomonas sp.]|nr:hypothetical protein [Roseomonas sp.]